MKNIIVAATALALSTLAAPAYASYAAADATLTGQILSSKGVPLSQASVLITGESKSAHAISDAQGTFSCANLAPGNYDMVVIADRYQAVFYRLNVAQGERITLTMTTSPMHPGEVIASVPDNDELNASAIGAQAWTQPVAPAAIGIPQAPAAVSVSEVDSHE